jgi:16S rRNA (guanine527-N7)-methyltransferase
MDANQLAILTQPYGLMLDMRQVAQFDRYLDLLLSWNEQTNLTRIVDPNEVIVRHFFDSLTCATVTGDLNRLRVIDVGTGAGFPGVPLKILFPSMRLTLADSVGKKTAFLHALVADLALGEVEILAERAETLGQNQRYREQFDWAMGRAVAHTRILAEYLLPLVKVGGKMLAMKGSWGEVESAESQHAISTLGGSAPTTTPIQLPNLADPHTIVTVAKQFPTPAKYPRRPGMPTKRPL